MYGLPVGTDLSALRGCRLDQVAAGRYQVILHFSEHNSITVEGDIAVTGPDGRRTVFDRPIPAAAVLAERLSAEVMDAVVAQPGTVSLTLSDGFRIDVHDSNDGYESSASTSATDWSSSERRSADPPMPRSARACGRRSRTCGGLGGARGRRAGAGRERAAYRAPTRD